MGVDTTKFKTLKKQADEARAARDRAAGQLEAAMERLREEFGCETLAQAEKKQKRLEAEAGKAHKAYEAAVAAFEEEWDEYTNGQDA